MNKEEAEIRLAGSMMDTDNPHPRGRRKNIFSIDNEEFLDTKSTLEPEASGKLQEVIQKWDMELSRDGGSTSQSEETKEQPRRHLIDEISSTVESAREPYELNSERFGESLKETGESGTSTSWVAW